MKRWISLALLNLSLNSQANMIQYFSGNNYQNPAFLFQTKQFTAELGGSGFYTRGKFDGNAFNFNTMQYQNGKSQTNTISVLPYGRLAKRVNEKWVLALDLTQPLHSNLRWGEHDVTRYAATQTLLTDTDISPKISYQLLPNLIFAGGVNINFMSDHQANWAYPTSNTTYSNLVNPSSSYGVGYNMGVVYMPNQTNILGLSYYSKINQKTKGTSQLAALTNNAYAFQFFMPPTTVIDYIHIFSPKWLGLIKTYYTQWSLNPQARFYNTAAPAPVGPNFIFNNNFKNSWAYMMGGRYQYNEKWGFLLLAMKDTSPAPDEFRVINFPGDDQYFIGLVADYSLNKTTTLQVLYGHGYMKSKTQAFPTQGNVKFHADTLDLKVSYKV